MKKIIVFLLIFLFPINVFSLSIKSKHAILYNLNDDEILYNLDQDTRISIASMTKIMTCIIAIESVDELEKQVTITSPMFYRLIEEGASVAGFEVGEIVTYRDLLYGLMLPSGADAAQALAISISGNLDEFVSKMNEKAKKLNLKNTHFSNPAGLDSKYNYSSVYDVAQILKYALKNDTFKSIFNAEKYTTSNSKHTFISTRNKYDIDTSFIDGSKTGFTYDAGLCLASTSHYNGVNYLLVTANAPYNDKTTHFKDAKEIYSYYFKNYENKIIINKDERITQISLMDGQVITYTNTDDVKKYLKKDCNIKKEYIGKTKVTEDIHLNDKIGEYIIKCDDELIYKKNIYLYADTTIIKKDSINIINVCIIAISCSILLFLIILLKRRKHY